EILRPLKLNQDNCTAFRNACHSHAEALIRLRRSENSRAKGSIRCKSAGSINNTYAVKTSHSNIGMLSEYSMPKWNSSPSTSKGYRNGRNQISTPRLNSRTRVYQVRSFNIHSCCVQPGKGNRCMEWIWNT